MRPHKVFHIYEDKRRLYTKALINKTHFQEHNRKDKGVLYREFDVTRSKVAAAIAKGATNVGIKENGIVLYLGVSHGYTASFISDMIGPTGLIFGIDPAPRVMRDLTFLTKFRPNIVPLLTDANHPETYINRIAQPDVIIQDIAQRNQLEIFLKNYALLKKGGYALLSIKARSIDITKKPTEIFIDIRKNLEKQTTVIDYRLLSPFEKDHCMIICKK